MKHHSVSTVTSVREAQVSFCRLVTTEKLIFQAFSIISCLFSRPHASLIDRMLQRDPKQRASLEEIERHAWLQGVDPSPATKYSTPLVSHKNLSEEEHNSIIQRMVLGDIADREAIVEYVLLPH